MKKSMEHSKFVYRNFDEIQNDINSGELNSWDLVLSKDTKEFILIKDDLTLAPIKSKVYRYIDSEEAEKELNNATDTYPGQIVAVLNRNGIYEGYIVNQKANGRYKVDPLAEYSGELDYDLLSHKPIVNIESNDYISPVILDTLKEGFYKVNGVYKISEYLDTIFSSYSSNLFWIHYGDSGEKYIKRIGATDITDWVINIDGSILTAIVPTTEWLTEQGYITEPYVDTKIAAMEFVNKNELEEYVQNVVLASINSLVIEVIDSEFNKRFTSATDQEIMNLVKK